MNKPKLFKLVLAFVLCSLFFIIQSSDVLARPGRRAPKHRHHPYYGRKVVFPRIFAQTVIAGGSPYFYYEGTFFHERNGGYIVTDAPLGARVKALPLGSRRYIINGKIYYHYNGVYFVRKPLGYFVVEDPVYQVVELPKEVKLIDNTVYVSPPRKNYEPKEEYIVNILNANGSYTPVKIFESDDGFLGPQGEYYLEFPTVAQLKVMYGK